MRVECTESKADQMKSVVITGSTRGIGHGLADAFLRLGCAVTVSGRTQQKVDEAVSELTASHGADYVLGQMCDVSRFEDVQALWNAAKTRFGKVDIWINNAGMNHGRIAFWHVPPEQIRAAVETNLIGAMNGSVVAIRGMLEQASGAIYNMEGLGSNGRRMEGLTLYGTTKCGLAYLTDALVEETRGTPLLVGAIRPGMVVTDLLMQPFEGRPVELERAKWIFNLLAERVETVTPWIAQMVLANRKTGVRIRWLTPTKILRRFLTAPFSKRDLFR